jgi:TolB-like protein
MLSAIALEYVVFGTVGREGKDVRSGADLIGLDSRICEDVVPCLPIDRCERTVPNQVITKTAFQYGLAGMRKRQKLKGKSKSRF